MASMARRLITSVVNYGTTRHSLSSSGKRPGNPPRPQYPRWDELSSPGLQFRWKIQLPNTEFTCLPIDRNQYMVSDTDDTGDTAVLSGSSGKKLAQFCQVAVNESISASVRNLRV